MQDSEPRQLSEADLENIGQVFDSRMTTVFEMIGYDVSDAESRGEIRDDHSFVRSFRKGSTKAQYAAGFAAISTFIGGFIWLLGYGLKIAAIGLLKAG